MVVDSRLRSRVCKTLRPLTHEIHISEDAKRTLAALVLTDHGDILTTRRPVVSNFLERDPECLPCFSGRDNFPIFPDSFLEHDSLERKTLLVAPHQKQIVEHDFALQVADCQAVPKHPLHGAKLVRKYGAGLRAPS
jgi:hypothetical protein